MAPVFLISENEVSPPPTSTLGLTMDASPPIAFALRLNIDPAVAAAGASELTAPAMRAHMESFLECVFRFRDACLMGFVETQILGLGNREHKCLASFGAVRGLANGQD